MGYDPEGVRRLREAMVATLDDLAACRSDDPEAHDAIRAVMRARSLLADTWLPLVDGLVRCVAMSEERPIRFDPSDIRQALPLMLVDRFGWTVRTDPLSGPLDDPPMTATDAAALAARLNNGDIRAFTDTDDELEWLTGKLAAIAANPALARAFTHNFTRWTELCDTLALIRVLALGEPTYAPPNVALRAANVDNVFAQLASIWTTTRSSTGESLVELDAMQPYAAAALARTIPMSADERAAFTARVIDRWAWGTPDDDPMRWFDRADVGPNTADLLLETLLGDPGACTRYLQFAIDDPRTMLMGSYDLELGTRVALMGTSPRFTDAATAATVVLPLLHYFADGDAAGSSPHFERYDSTWIPFLADLCAPWLLQFSPLNADWGTSTAEAVERRRLLEFVLDDSAALKQILAAGQAAIEGLAISLRSHGRTDTSLEEVAAFIGMLGQLSINERVADEQQRADTWELWWNLASLPLTLLPVVPGVIGKMAMSEIHHQTRERGWLGAPSPAGVRDQARYQAEWMLTVAGAAMAAASFDRIVHRGDVDRDAPGPPEPDPTSPSPQFEYERQYLAWKRATFDSIDDPRADEVDAWKSPFLNAAGAGDAFAEL